LYLGHARVHVQVCVHVWRQKASLRHLLQAFSDMLTG